MNRTFRRGLCAAILALPLCGPAFAQLGGGMGGAMPSPLPGLPEKRPTETGDPYATQGDRHDIDGYPGAANNGGPHMSYGASLDLRAAASAAKNKDWATAKAKLAAAEALPKLTDFDRFEIDVMSSFVALNAADHPGALACYKKVIASPFFAKAQTPDQQAATLRNAMVLSNEAADYSGTIALGSKLAASGSMDSDSAITLAAGYFGNKDYADAQTLAQKAIDAETAAGKTPNETAVQIVTQSKANLH